MRKLLPVVPAIVIFGISAILFVFMCLPPDSEASYRVFEMDSHFLRTRAVYLVAFGGIFFTAINHLALYFFRRRDKEYLLFALVCILYAAHTVFTRNGFVDTFGWMPYGGLLAKTRGTVGFLFWCSITCLGLYTTRMDVLLAHKKKLVVGLCLGVGYCVFAPLSPTRYEQVTFLAMLFGGIFLVAVFAKSPALKENKWIRLYFASYILFILLGVFWVFIDPGTFLMPGFSSVLFMVLSHGLLLSKKYADAFHLIEETNQNLERIVEERTHNLQVTNDAMKELVSNISHDIKTPLAVMSVNLELLSSLATTQSNADYRRHVRVAYQKNLDLQRLIQNLFEVSYIETGRQLYEPRWESLLRLLVKAKEKYDDYMEDHGLYFDVDVEDDIDILTDPQKIWSVFDNVVYNAVRHTAKGGVTVTAHKEGTKATVTITDTGCGIESKHLPHVFERFYRGSQARSANEGESGLGLYIVKSVMEGCRGRAEIESEWGKGTSVILTFPALL